MFLVIGGLSMMSHHYTLGNIKSRTVGDGQHGTARWATDKEIRQTYAHVPFKVREWRRGQNLPMEQGVILGCKGKPQELTALVDSNDIHCLMIGASGIGKTAFFLYPNLEYACASGMSWLALDSKGDLARNYGTIAKNCYEYNVSVIDLRNPPRSDGNNLLTLVNRYMDIARKDPKNLAARAKAEKYAKILAKTIINPDGDDSNRGQNAFFYDAAEGLLTSVILILAEFLPPDKEHPQERRHTLESVAAYRRAVSMVSFMVPLSWRMSSKVYLAFSPRSLSFLLIWLSRFWIRVISERQITAPDISLLAITGRQLTDTLVFVPGMVRIRPLCSRPPVMTVSKSL